MRNIFIIMFAFFFGYSIKREGKDMILQRHDLTMDQGKDDNSIVDKIRLLNDSKIEVVNVKEKFGVVGDGVTDNYQAILKAATYAKDNDTCFYLPKGNYYCSQNVVIEGVKHIIIDGSIKMDTGKAITILYDSYLASANWKIYDIQNGKLVLSGLNSSKVEVIKAKELELYAHGDIEKKEFIAYNTFILGKIDKLKIFSEGAKAGWVNENKFYGGRIMNIVIDGNFNHDNNIFYGTMLEGFTLDLNKGASNFFYDVRLEGNNSVTFGAGTSDNVIYRSWQANQYSYLRDSVNTSCKNYGFNNHIISNLDKFHKRDTIFNIDSKSNNFKLSVITKNKFDLTIANSDGVLFETDLIELRNPFGIIAKSDKSLFLIDLYAYDANKKLILTEQTNFTALSDGKFNTMTGAYSFDENVGIENAGVPLFPNGTVKFVRYRIRTGSKTKGKVFNYLNIIKIEANVYQTLIKISNKFKRWTHTEIPSAGYWEEGDIVWNVGTNNTILLWRRLTTGKNHELGKDWVVV